MSYIKLHDISKKFHEEQALGRLNLLIEEGEFVALVGPSGSGKSTMLDIICGFEQSDSGYVAIAGKDVTDLTPKERDVAMVFQNYALFPHMTVAENLAFGMKIRKIAKKERQMKVAEVANLLSLSEYLNKYPKELSGGQKQRVALGRAIVREPKLFLMDEPLSNLDTSLREQMSSEIKKLQKVLSVTTLYVTHSQDEAMLMADKIVVLNKGVIHQVGTPHQIYQQPADLFVASFIGKPKINLITGCCQNGSFSIKNHCLGKLSYPDKYEGQELIIGIRSEHIEVTTNFNECHVTINNIAYLGQETLYYLENTHGLKLTVRQINPLVQSVGDDLFIKFNLEKAVLFDKQTTKRIGED
ncbi:ABC transporter ATP-binding protein [Vagococcus intermedius]|uniref:ABC transporter ATP-binding protein n=1 Tax=Vagococcus intermedius TaxID=2991418 RepID=A0AAF0CVD3_9ENTE|nr:ABC transporter ATP-binding protein [Vagococcus intermedius]WEG73668.1 ABC transporter ATP-binding protein [Vagococcus intermedius]WEG75752.1 ABC transporter ATP-binding protein [Vagococcus intermedius]